MLQAEALTLRSDLSFLSSPREAAPSATRTLAMLKSMAIRARYLAAYLVICSVYLR